MKSEATKHTSNKHTKAKNDKLKRKNINHSTKKSNVKSEALVKTENIPVAPATPAPVYRTILSTKRESFPYSIFFISLICAALFLYMLFNYVQINERTVAISTLKNEIADLSFEAESLTAKLDIKNDLTIIEEIARDKLGMVTVDEVTKKYITMVTPDSIEPIGKKG